MKALGLVVSEKIFSCFSHDAPRDRACMDPRGTVGRIYNQRTIGPENAHLKPDLGVLSHNEMTLTLNTHTPLLTSLVVCICKVSGLRLQ